LNFEFLTSINGEVLLARRPSPKLQGLTMSAVRDCLFSILAVVRIWRPSPPSATWGRAMSWWLGPT